MNSTPKLIFCCGLIRSGSTVLYQIASGIVELRGDGQRCGYYEPILDQRQIPELDTWQVYKVPWLGEYEQKLIGAGAIALYSHRQVEESLASAYRAFRVPEGKRWFWRAIAEGHVSEIERLGHSLKIHHIPFETIRDALRAVIVQISEVIPGRELAPAELDSLATELSLDRQKTRLKIHPYDPVTLLFPQHFD